MTQSETEQNRAAVRAAFEAWAAGTGSFTDLLGEDAEWTIAGSGPSAQTFPDRQAFLDHAYGPIAEHFVSPMTPVVRGLYADGDTVIVLWDGAAAMTDGQTYRNRYAWFFKMRGGKVVRATAFLDLPTYDAALAGDPLPAWPAQPVTTP